MKKITVFFAIAVLVSVAASADWLPFPTKPDTFAGSDGLIWTVDPSAFGSTMSYKIIDGDTCVVAIALIGTNVMGEGRELSITLPDGIVPNGTIYQTALIGGLGTTGETIVGYARVLPSIRQIYIGPLNATFKNPTFTVSVFGEITFPIQQQKKRRVGRGDGD